ncbi:NUDIX domain-containing protein [Neisseriaceae bacterium PsAf]|nr:NUDIX domain-containing protein [Neisseriaceae bacterium PsAf]MCV2502661.1 NUDIX domain-containing protein [Neisseriaceae bacterium]
MSHRKQIKVVAAIIFNNERQVLISTRPKGKSYPGYWEFAGGKQEIDETSFQALQRELDEELGLKIDYATPWLKKNVVYEKVYLSLFFWRVYPKDWNGVVTPRENQEWEWVDIRNLIQKKLLPANYSFVNALQIPEDFFLINSVLLSDNEEVKILPYREAMHKKQSIYISYKDVENLGRLPNFEWIAIVVENKKEMRASLDAHALIWNISSEKSFQELVEVLSEGQFIPILAINFSEEEEEKLKRLGIHGFIHASSLMTA